MHHAQIFLRSPVRFPSRRRRRKESDSHPMQILPARCQTFQCNPFSPCIKWGMGNSSICSSRTAGSLGHLIIMIFHAADTESARPSDESERNVVIPKRPVFCGGTAVRARGGGGTLRKLCTPSSIFPLPSGAERGEGQPVWHSSGEEFGELRINRNHNKRKSHRCVVGRKMKIWPFR